MVAVVLPVGRGAPLSPVGLPLVWVVAAVRHGCGQPEFGFRPRPRRLRDVDGFLLKQAEGDAEPDREHLPLLAGYVHTAGSYPPALFSASQWRSDEHDRTDRDRTDRDRTDRDRTDRDRTDQQLLSEVDDAHAALTPR